MNKPGQSLDEMVRTIEGISGISFDSIPEDGESYDGKYPDSEGRKLADGCVFVAEYDRGLVAAIRAGGWHPNLVPSRVRIAQSTKLSPIIYRIRQIPLCAITTDTIIIDGDDDFTATQGYVAKLRSIYDKNLPSGCSRIMAYYYPGGCTATLRPQPIADSVGTAVEGLKDSQWASISIQKVSYGPPPDLHYIYRGVDITQLAVDRHLRYIPLRDNMVLDPSPAAIHRYTPSKWLSIVKQIYKTRHGIGSNCIINLAHLMKLLVRDTLTKRYGGSTGFKLHGYSKRSIKFLIELNIKMRLGINWADDVGIHRIITHLRSLPLATVPAQLRPILRYKSKKLVSIPNYIVGDVFDFIPPKGWRWHEDVGRHQVVRIEDVDGQHYKYWTTKSGKSHWFTPQMLKHSKILV